MALLCHCHAVSDRQVVAVVEQAGPDLGEVQQRCQAGTSCGGCLPAVEELVTRVASQLVAGA